MKCKCLTISEMYHRENLTTMLPALECRHLSSDDDGLSTDGMDSIYDTADEEDNEELALTFDLPGMLIRTSLVVCLCVLTLQTCRGAFGFRVGKEKRITQYSGYIVLCSVILITNVDTGESFLICENHNHVIRTVNNL